MAESFRINGVEPNETMVRKLAEALVQGYEQARDELRTTGRALPGAADALRALANEPAVYQSALTGNLREVAGIKLEVFGMDRYLDLDSGAYGDDDASRAALVPIAQRRAMERTGARFDNGSTVLIGDTPNDVQAALTAGVRAIAVASGKSDEDALRQAGATTVLSDLPDPARLVRHVIEAER